MRSALRSAAFEAVQLRRYRWFDLAQLGADFERDSALDVLGFLPNELDARTLGDTQCSLCQERLVDESGFADYFAEATVGEWPYARLGAFARRRVVSRSPDATLDVPLAECNTGLGVDVEHAQCLVAYAFTTFLDINQRLRVCAQESVATTRDSLDFTRFTDETLLWSLLLVTARERDVPIVEQLGKYRDQLGAWRQAGREWAARAIEWLRAREQWANTNAREPPGLVDAAYALRARTLELAAVTLREWFYAAETGDATTIRRALRERRIDINAPNNTPGFYQGSPRRTYRTALTEALVAENYEIAKILLFEADPPADASNVWQHHEDVFRYSQGFLQKLTQLDLLFGFHRPPLDQNTELPFDEGITAFQGRFILSRYAFHASRTAIRYLLNSANPKPDFFTLLDAAKSAVNGGDATTLSMLTAERRVHFNWAWLIELAVENTHTSNLWKFLNVFSYILLIDFKGDKRRQQELAEVAWTKLSSIIIDDNEPVSFFDGVVLSLLIDAGLRFSNLPTPRPPALRRLFGFALIHQAYELRIIFVPQPTNVAIQTEKENNMIYLMDAGADVNASISSLPEPYETFEGETTAWILAPSPVILRALRDHGQSFTERLAILTLTHSPIKKIALEMMIDAGLVVKAPLVVAARYILGANDDITKFLLEEGNKQERADDERAKRQRTQTALRSRFRAHLLDGRGRAHFP